MKDAIFVLSYNHPEHTARAVCSILPFGSTHRLCLVHNGSQPQNVASLQFQFPQIEHLILEKNKGYTGGVNFGFQTLFEKSENVMLLTNDCVLLSLPTKKAEVLVPQIFRRHLNVVDSFGGAFDPCKGHLQHCRNGEDFLLARHPYVPGSAFQLSRSAWETVGKMDEALGTYWEDVDWSMRAQQRGLKFTLCEDWQILHKVGKTCHKDSFYTLFSFQRNRKRVSLRYLPAHKKIWLYTHLTRDWIKLFFHLLAHKRFQDLRYLPKIIFD